MLTITENAKNQLDIILSTPHNVPEYVRIIVTGGGCAGFSYRFEVDIQNPEDLVIDRVVIDPLSAETLGDAVLDYKNELTGAYFYLDIPRATSRCGCATSFSL
jgi:iron-sulfur cluster insertion protein